MAENTLISWAHHTHNVWIGCERISPTECANCYAADLDARFGGDNWSGKPYQLLSEDYWKKPLRWDKKAEAAGERHRVFCGSMCDWADVRGYDSERKRMWDMIRLTPNLDWLLLSKRGANMKRHLPDDWGDGYTNAWIGVSCGDRKYGVPRLEHLRALPAKIRFVSFEPLLEDLGELDLTGIHWAIIGGESGRRARPMEAEWVMKLIAQCIAQGVQVFFKQWGGKKADKGGHLIDGQVIQFFPRGTAPYGAAQDDSIETMLAAVLR